ncbi:hypothetical protein BT93_B1493 [Corymbia citriodora subsp. variegata]|nr:hypothetical protein BT93_B1493 [Corymbia citriodora subsp. variegata]
MALCMLICFSFITVKFSKSIANLGNFIEKEMGKILLYQLLIKAMKRCLSFLNKCSSF